MGLLLLHAVRAGFLDLQQAADSASGPPALASASSCVRGVPGEHGPDWGRAWRDRFSKGASRDSLPLDGFPVTTAATSDADRSALAFAMSLSLVVGLLIFF